METSCSCFRNSTITTWDELKKKTWHDKKKTNLYFPVIFLTLPILTGRKFHRISGSSTHGVFVYPVREVIHQRVSVIGAFCSSLMMAGAFGSILDFGGGIRYSWPNCWEIRGQQGGKESRVQYPYMFQVPGPPPTPPAMVMVITHQPPSPLWNGWVLGRGGGHPTRTNRNATGRIRWRKLVSSKRSMYVEISYKTVS